MIDSRFLNYLSEIETIKHTLMHFYPNVELKLVVLLGYKDRSGNKRRYIEEYRYESSKYKNMDHLISVTENFDSFLVLEYPGVNSNSIIYLRDYMIYGLLDKMNEFDKMLLNPFYVNPNTKELTIIPSKVTPVTSYPNNGTSIYMCQDIYIDSNGKSDCGVKFVLNNEFSMIVRMSTVWKRFLYIMNTCDLFTWSHLLAQPYIDAMSGMNVNSIDIRELNKRNNLNQEDPEDIINDPNTMRYQKSLDANKEF